MQQLWPQKQTQVQDCEEKNADGSDAFIGQKTQNAVNSEETQEA